MQETDECLLYSSYIRPMFVWATAVESSQLPPISNSAGPSPVLDWTLCPSREPLSCSPFSHPVSPSTWNRFPKVTCDQDESLLYNLCLKRVYVDLTLHQRQTGRLLWVCLAENRVCSVHGTMEQCVTSDRMMSCRWVKGLVLLHDWHDWNETM